MALQSHGATVVVSVHRNRVGGSGPQCAQLCPIAVGGGCTATSGGIHRVRDAPAVQRLGGEVARLEDPRAHGTLAHSVAARRTGECLVRTARLSEGDDLGGGHTLGLREHTVYPEIWEMAWEIMERFDPADFVCTHCADRCSERVIGRPLSVVSGTE